MESKDELKEIDIKNHLCCYFDDIMAVRGRLVIYKNFIQNLYGFKTTAYLVR